MDGIVKYNHWLPKLISKKMPIDAITIWPFIFVKLDYFDQILLNHEKIHIRQYTETLVVGFYLIYAYDYLLNRLIRKKSHVKAYLNIRLEREAYANQYDENYMYTRKHYAWRHYKHGRHTIRN